MNLVKLAVCTLVLVSGCSSSSLEAPCACDGGSLDAATSADGASPVDLATPFDGTTRAQYVVSSLTLPANMVPAAYDFDGDGTPDNGLAKIVSTAGLVGLDLQAGASQAITSGALVMLLEQASTDPQQHMAKDASVAFLQGKPTAAPPKLDGDDAFVIDTTTAPGAFSGDIVSEVFTSRDPRTAVTPVKAVFPIAMFAGQPPILAPITAARITFRHVDDGTLIGGQMNGAIMQADLDAVVVPAIAAQMTVAMHGPSAPAALKVVDANGDGTITAAELKGNFLLSGFFAPDVQLYTGGVYKPNPAKTQKDALSLGVLFQAVPAKF